MKRILGLVLGLTLFACQSAPALAQTPACDGSAHIQALRDLDLPKGAELNEYRGAQLQTARDIIEEMLPLPWPELSAIGVVSFRDLPFVNVAFFVDDCLVHVQQGVPASIYERVREQVERENASLDRAADGIVAIFRAMNAQGGFAALGR